MDLEEPTPLTRTAADRSRTPRPHHPDGAGEPAPDLAHVRPEPRAGDLGLRFLHGADVLVQDALRLLLHRARPAKAHARKRHRPSNSRLGMAAAHPGDAMGRAAALSTP